MNIAVLGSVFGDEGKARIVHDFSPDHNWVIRWNGGQNAGHTIYRDGKKYVHNLLPSIDFRNSSIKGFLASGMVIDLDHLLFEIKESSKDFPNVGSRIYVDPDTFIVSPEHKEIDKSTNAHIGSTNRGIGPAYSDKINRKGVRIQDLINQNSEKITALKNVGVQFKTVLEMRSEFSKSNLLFEGAQGILLDINHGTYPFVSCSDCTVSGIYCSGFNWVKLNKVYGIAKAYTTRVGNGPFPTEYFNDEAEQLRIKGKEFGATTGRPRRIGAIDLPAMRYAVAKGGIDTLIITKLDVLNGCKTVKVCTEYQSEPVSGSDFFSAEPKYIEMPGWVDSKSSKEINEFINLIEKEVGMSVDYISTGVNPEDLVKRK